MLRPPSDAMLAQLAAGLGPKGFTRDLDAMTPWLTDWRGRYRGACAALLAPATTAEVQAIVRLCADNDVALVPQGGNSSMVGGATPDGGGGALLLSLRRMDGVRRVCADDNLLIAEAGATLSAVHDAAAAAGRRFPLSLGAKGSATVGGLVSTNAGGTQVLRHGTMRSLVAGLEAVLPSGDRLDGLAALKKDNRGYDVGHLLIGAEGTLGVVTAAALRLLPAISTRAVAWAGVAEPHAALELLRRLERGSAAVESFELVPASALRLVLDHIPATRSPLADAHPWNVLIEWVGDASNDRLEGALASAAADGLVADAALAANEAQADAFWRLRDSISEAERIDGAAAKHDVSVPVSAMPGFIVDAAAATEARFAGARVVAFGHLGDGNVHFNVRAPAHGDAAQWLAEHGAAVTAFVHDLVMDAGGSISAEHGIGQLKLAELGRTGDPVRLAAQIAIKRALDPRGIMNPGKLVPAGANA
jgi:FAD/FMN-containing dehydrogenase